MKKILTIAIILLFVSCTPVIRSIDVGHIVDHETYIPSKVLHTRSMGIADTTLALFKGQTFQAFIFDGIENIEQSKSVMIVAVNRLTGNQTKFYSKENGVFEVYLTTGSYDIKFSSLALSPVKIDSLSFGVGEIRQLTVLLGASGSQKKTSVYKVEPNGTLSESIVDSLKF